MAPLSRSPSLKLENTVEDNALHYNIGHHSGTSGIVLPDGLKHRRLSKHLHHLDHGIEAELKHKVVLSTEDKLLGLPGNLALSSAQTDTYFGTEGRSRFFERSKWVHRQRHNTNVSSKEPVKKLFSNFNSPSLSKEIAFNPPDRIVKRRMMMMSPTTSASASVIEIVGVSSTDFQRQVNRFNNRSDGDADIDIDALSRLIISKKLATQT